MPPRVSPYPMLSVPQALETVLAHVAPLPAEDVSFLEARGRVLAQDVFADADLPLMPRSSVDGYAVRSADADPTRAVTEEITAGHLATDELRSGQAIRIMTGGMLPPGADAVIMVEEAEEADGRVTFLKLPRSGENVHPPGLDLAHGQLVLASGTVIGPAEVGLLATVGQVRVAVHRRPRVAVLATGDEIVEPDRTPPPGAVRDSNRFALMAAAAEAGAEVVWQRHGVDDERTLAGLFEEALAAGDVLLTSGGVSMGTRDLVKPLIDRFGTLHFGRIAFKPGKPLTFASTPEGQYIFGLPGFPVSSLVTFEVFVRPALLKLGGRRQVLRPRVDVELGHEVRPDPTRLEYQRAVVTWEDGRYVARNTGSQSSSRLISIAGANALLEIETGEGVLPAGSRVKALLLADL